MFISLWLKDAQKNPVSKILPGIGQNLVKSDPVKTRSSSGSTPSTDPILLAEARLGARPFEKPGHGMTQLKPDLSSI